MMRNTLLLKNAQAVAANPPKAGVFNWGFQMVFNWYSTGMQLVCDWYETDPVEPMAGWVNWKLYI